MKTYLSNSGSPVQQVASAVSTTGRTGSEMLPSGEEEGWSVSSKSANWTLLKGQC